MICKNVLTVLRNMVMFASVYGFSKCVKTLLCGLCLIPVLLFVHRFIRKKSAVLSCYLWLLLLPMAFMGMSKLFYQKYLIYITAYLIKYVKEWHGYIYFGVMLVLFMAFIIRNIRLRKKLEKMTQINDTSVINGFVDSFCEASNTGSIGARYLKRVKVYFSDTDESPFSGGIVKPYIVLPQGTWRQLGEESRYIVLCHELIHIKSGHILLLTVFKFLTFLWWVNPFIYVCESLLQEDIELACDECTIAYTGIAKHTYGCVLLGMIEHLSQNTSVAVASFIDRNDFAVLKKRITYIGRKKADRMGLSRQMCMGAVLAVFILSAVFALIVMTSYPRYTIIEEIYVYSEDIELIAYDTAEIRDAFWVEGRQLHIDEESFQRFLEQENVSGDYVYVSFGTVMKLPGIGGGGDVVMVNVEDVSDTFNVAADTIENHIMELFLRLI